MTKVVSDLKSVVEALAVYLHMDATDLYVWTQKDQHTGWDFDKGDWPCGSLHRPEGQILYALVRALKAVPVEIGSWHGCSATHMAEALRDAGIEDSVQSVDLSGMNRERIPDYLAGYITSHSANGHDYLQALDDESQMLIYEDAGHDREGTGQFWREGLAKLAPGGVMVSHDPENAIVGANVIAGVEDAGITDYIIVRVPPSDCGLLIYRKPGELPKPVPLYFTRQEWEAMTTPWPIVEDTAPPKETPKRKGKRHAAPVHG